MSKIDLNVLLNGIESQQNIDTYSESYDSISIPKVVDCEDNEKSIKTTKRHYNVPSAWLLFLKHRQEEMKQTGEAYKVNVRMKCLQEWKDMSIDQREHYYKLHHQMRIDKDKQHNSNIANNNGMSYINDLCNVESEFQEHQLSEDQKLDTNLEKSRRSRNSVTNLQQEL